MTLSMVMDLWKSKTTFEGYKTSEGYEASESSFLVTEKANSKA